MIERYLCRMLLFLPEARVALLDTVKQTLDILQDPEKNMGRFSKEDKVNVVQVIKLIICFCFLCFVVFFTSPEYKVLMVSVKHCWLSITHPLATWFILYTTISFNKRKLDCSVQAYCPWILPFSGFHLISD